MPLRSVPTRPQDRDLPEAGAGDAHIIAMLNDLLQLEHDALPAYRTAILGLRDPERRAALERFREDHLRHVDELVALIEARGGTPWRLPHLPTGLFKLALQMAGLPGGDRAILLAFKANEWQSQEKYARRALEADGQAPEILNFLRRAAADEERHYEWVCRALDGMGLGEGTPIGMANGAFARFHGTLADGIEGVGRMAMEAAARLRRPG